MACAALIGACGTLYAQDWNTGGNFINLPTQYLGCDLSSTQPLRLMTKGSQPIEFHTNARPRMRINQTTSYPVQPGLPNAVADGYVAITPNINFFASVPGPYSRLHLATGVLGQNTQYLGWRPWMDNGVYFSGNRDNMYLGQKFNGLDYSDAIVSWSDNPGSALGDRMRFLFTSSYTGAATGNGSLEGLEGMRLKPAEGGTEILVGIGDFYAGGDDPTERLDVRTGQVRIRQLPADPVSTSTEFVTVNTTPGPNYGLLEHKPIASLPDNCEWTMSVGIPNHVWTAEGAFSSSCPDESDCVGIGAGPTEIFGKLSVDNDPLATGKDRAIVVRNNYPYPTATSGTQIGIDVSNHGFASSLGGYFKAYGNGTDAFYAGPTGTWSLGRCDGQCTDVFGARATAEGNGTTSKVRAVFGESASSGSSDLLVGVDGYASRTTPGTGMIIGVRGGATDGSGSFGPEEWAGWFDGNVKITGFLDVAGTIYTSDGTLKTNVQPLTSALSKIKLLQPKTYEYDLVNHPGMGLQPGMHYGFISQDVQLDLPELTADMHMEPELDAVGNVVNAATTYLGMEYVEVIPILVGAVQEMSDKLDVLEAIVASCCAVNDGGNLNFLPGGGSSGASPSGDQRLMVHPNPFTERTAIAYALDRDAAISMTVMSVSGQLVSTLDLGQAQAGLFTYEWNTGGMAPGQYIVSLLADGEVDAVQVVKLED